MKPSAFRIYPSIGVARLGNGPAEKNQVIFSPEIPWDNLYKTDENYLTKDGRIKKQAQRFYVYECDENGVPVKRVDPKDYDIEWSAEVANKKPFWYNFSNSLDLSIQSTNRNLSPDFAKNKLAPGIPVAQRNPNVLRPRLPGDYDYRKELVNRPSMTSVSSRRPKMPLKGFFPFAQEGNTRLEAEPGLEPRQVPFSLLAEVIAKLFNQLFQRDESKSARVNLGSLEYDNGALIFYAADGKSASLNPSDLNTDFADNSNWYDDICDGRITATLTSKVDGSKIELNDAHSAAWVVTAPPDYAPQIQPIATMFDILLGASNEIFPTDFSLVFPMLYRLYRMQWVNLGDFLSPSFKETIDKLTAEGKFKYLFKKEPADEASAVRKQVFDLFRDPAYPSTNEPIIPSSATTSIVHRGSGTDALKLPFYPGDGINYPGSPSQWFAIPPLLHDALKQWRDGDFATLEDQDFDNIDALGAYFRAKFLEAATEPSKQPLLMTRAVLETLYGGGFHPGVELTWPMRHNLIYAENHAVFASVAQQASLFGLREVRINAATQADQKDIFFNDFGYQMDARDIESSMNPDINHWLWKITPGDLTKWMGIPWQSDAGSCQAVFIEKQYPIPAWWAANLPVHVLPDASFYKLQDSQVLDGTKRNIYANRLPWLQTTDTGFVGYHAEGGYMNGLISMVYQWNRIGMVTGRKIDPPIEGIPAIVYVAFNGPQDD